MVQSPSLRTTRFLQISLSGNRITVHFKKHLLD